ncbi:MAG: universal stress protein [Nitrospiraceae bacterium]|nr:universal stress protein [Nitrospiraceae bacterium]
MNKILIAIDGSECSMKAVNYAGDHFSGIDGIEITLLYVLPMPAVFWDEGHFLSDEEKRERGRFLEQWKDEQRLKIEPVFQKATEVLAGKGVKREQIVLKTASDTVDAADRILDETRSGGFKTMLLGHCRHDTASHYIRGSVTHEILHRLQGTTLIIVE